MEIELLNPQLIEKYHTTFSRINPAVNLFDVFLSTLINTVDPTCKISPLDSSDKVLGNYVFKSQEEAELLFNQYIAFINSTISFLESVEIIKETVEREKQIELIFNQFCNIYKNDYPVIFDTVIANCELLQENINRFYNIPANATTEQYNEIIKKEFHMNGAILFTAFSTVYKNAAVLDTFSISDLNKLYIFFFEFIIVLNLHRKNNFSKTAKQRVTSISAKDVGRNDPCPCGSGIKYKKCCMIKIN